MTVYGIFVLFLIAYCWAVQASELSLDELPLPHRDCPKFDDVNQAKKLPYPQDCTKYYSCFNGFGFPKKCMDQLHFSPSTFRCEYPENAGCQSLANTMLNSKPKRCTECDVWCREQNQIYLPYPGDCHRFIQCNELLAYLRYCPDNMLWNDKLKICDKLCVVNDI